MVGLLGLTACDGINAFDVDLDEFDRLPRFEELDFSKVSPGGSFQYWELRHAFGGRVNGTDRIIASGGSRTRPELGAATIAALDSIRPATGYAIGCLPGYCYKFIAAVDTQVRLYNTRESLRTFLGTIDSREEAALIADAHNFWWDDSNETGVREVSGGWEIIGLQLVKDCAPVQTDRVHMRIGRDGSLKELDREVHSKLENACV